MNTHSKTVFVGLSGGVDSSVAALRLIKEGYNVVGVFIKVWQPDFLDCNWEAERLDAMRVAAHLDIPFLMCDAEAAYRDEVGKYFIEEYRKGRTPNPDVMCNKEVKFGAFLDFALKNGADYVATGHYAQKTQDMKDGTRHYELHRGVDTNKDQSYFLWTLTQEQLSHILLPVGNSTKDVIRKEALGAHIPVAAKKDSQGVCFLGHIDIPEFLSHFMDLQSGNALNTSGEIIGTHKGAVVYTRGQRHGFTITRKIARETGQYVVDRDIVKNTITVDHEPPTTTKNKVMQIDSINLIRWKPEIGMHLELQTRYRQNVVSATIKAIAGDSISLTFDTQHDIYSAGQSCVLYDNNRCLGGGIIAG